MFAELIQSWLAWSRVAIWCFVIEMVDALIWEQACLLVLGAISDLLSGWFFPIV